MDPLLIVPEINMIQTNPLKMRHFQEKRDVDLVRMKKMEEPESNIRTHRKDLVDPLIRFFRQRI